MAGVDGLGKRRTVLVVEDDRSTSDMLRAFVESQGFRFVPANEGHLVLELACEERPILITLDLDLPDTDGHAVLHRLLADDRTRDIPIVVVSGYSEFLPAADGQRIAGVMTKPLDLDGLADVMRTVVASDGVR